VSLCPAAIARSLRCHERGFAIDDVTDGVEHDDVAVGSRIDHRAATSR
jgi:hypothetical protein